MASAVVGAAVAVVVAVWVIAIVLAPFSALPHDNNLTQTDTHPPGSASQENGTSTLPQDILQSDSSSSQLAQAQNNAGSSESNTDPHPEDTIGAIPPLNRPKAVGNVADIDLRTGMNTLFLTSPDERVSVRFTAKYSGDVSTVSLALQSLGPVDGLVMGLQKDNGGLPSGEWMNATAFGTGTEVEKEGRFATAQLQQSAPLTTGEVYHVVIENAGANPDDATLVTTYRANALAQPFNDEDPDVLWPDNSMTVLFYDGMEWKDQNVWPIFAIGYSDGRLEGQPYSLAAQWVIFEDRYVGQTFVAASHYSVEKMAFVAGLRGEPKDNLYYQVMDSSDNVLATGQFATAQELTTSKQWVEVTFEDPLLFVAGESYRMVFLSPRTDLDNPYHIFGHEFSYSKGIGYGGPGHHLTISYDGGVVWSQWDDADAIFRLDTRAGE